MPTARTWIGDDLIERRIWCGTAAATAPQRTRRVGQVPQDRRDLGAVDRDVALADHSLAVRRGQRLDQGGRCSGLDVNRLVRFAHGNDRTVKLAER